MGNHFSAFLDQIMKDNPSVIFKMDEDDGYFYVFHSFVNASHMDLFMGNIGRAMETHLFKKGLFNIGIGYDASLDGDSAALATYYGQLGFVAVSELHDGISSVESVVIESIIKPQRGKLATTSMKGFAYSPYEAYPYNPYAKVA